MRRFLTFMVSLLALTGLVAGPAAAASPHFIRASAALQADGDLVVSFKLAGLGDNQTLTITAAANASAVYACRNNGGNFPADPKKTEVTGVVTASGEFTSGKNGQITGSLTLEPPASDLSCPPGQTVVLVSVVYTNVSVSAPGAGTESIPGTFSKVFFNI
jgi:hypothetical protein